MTVTAHDEWLMSPASRKYGPTNCEVCGQYSSSRTCWTCSQIACGNHPATIKLYVRIGELEAELADLASREAITAPGAIRERQLVLPHGDLSARNASSKLRSGLAYAILVGLRGKGWTCSRLGEAAGLDPALINSLTHNRADCSFETAGRILFALGVSARLVLETDP